MADDDETREVRVTNTGLIGDEVAERLDETRLSSIERQLDDLNEKLNNLNDIGRNITRLRRDIEDLQNRIETIEREKARAERKAVANLKDTLREEFKEKRHEYERRVKEVLDDYRDSVGRLKNQFLGAITGHDEEFAMVENQFEDVQAHRREVVDAAAATGATGASNYEDRAEAIIQSRNRFVSAAEEFMNDREDTANAINSLRTQVPHITGQTTIAVPFWVVGVQKDGREEIRVHPVLDRGDSDGDLDRANPYVEYLRNHPTHAYSDMIDTVKEQVVHSEMRHALASQQKSFADPSFLRRNDAIDDRFVDALAEFELDDRPVSGGGERSQSGSQSEKVVAND
jgi:hypothetical protein